jgi:hypothetical protein
VQQAKTWMAGTSPAMTAKAPTVGTAQSAFAHPTKCRSI